MPALTRADAAHLLRRTGFGGTATEIDAYVGLDRAEAVQRAMDLAAAPAAQRPGELANATSQYGAWMIALYSWIERMVTTPTPLQEKLTLFWHGHFATQCSKIGEAGQVFDQVQMLREMGLGEFSALCDAVAKDTAMLGFLENGSNVRTAPQENFARELMELFTLGLGNYAESDVPAMARAWTGHNYVGWTPSGWDGSYRFRPDQHDGGVKVLFGIARPWDGPETIEEIVHGSKQADCARFITRKLLEFFVSPEPTEAMVTDVSNAFRSSGMDVGAALRAALLHDEFWAATSRYALVKSPTEFVVELLRRTATPASDYEVHWAMPAMGQTLFDPPSVRGWPGHDAWLATSAMSARMTWVASIRWKAAERGFWADLATRTDADGTQFILDELGIDTPSGSTVATVGSWFAECKRAYTWMVPPNALLLGAMLPEFQVK